MTEPESLPQHNRQRLDTLEQAVLDRTQRGYNRILVLAAFMLLVGLSLGFLLQRQEHELRRLTNFNHEAIITTCEVRRVAVIHTNATWESLAAIEERNKFIDEDIRQARLTSYRQAMLVVPDCAALR